MVHHRPLDPTVPWTEVTADDSDWDAAEPALLTGMLSQLVLIRTFEELVLQLAGEGLIHGPAHSSIGQEGGAVGSAISLRTTDHVNGSHRGHHQFLAKVLAHLHPEGLDPTAPFPADVEQVLLRTLREICGLDQGFSHGRGGSMHLQWLEAGAIGTNAIVGGGVPLAAGSAWAHKHAGTDDVTITYFGDGATNIGSTLETMNLAGAWSLPLCFFIENNLYAVSTHVSEVTAETRLSGRGPGFGIRSWKVDGMDPLAVHLAMQEALEHMRRGQGPAVVEADVYRYYHQNGPFPGSAFRYRSKEEEAEWRSRDPIARTVGHLVRRGILTQEQADGTTTAAQQLMRRLAEVVLEPKPDGKPKERQIKPSEWPDPGMVDFGIRGDLSELADIAFSDMDDHVNRLQDVKFIDAVAGVMARRMEEDDRIVVLGEDVHRLSGGTNGATKGLKDAFPDRVLGTPIAENAFTGLGGGIALDGRYRPVVEFMYADFMWVAADQLFNQIAKARHMFGGTSAVPFVLRSKTAMGTGYGSQHSMDPAGGYATSAGFRIVAPSTPYDYVGLMNTALALDDPVVVIEHVDLYTSTGPGLPDDFDHFLPVGKAQVRRTGTRITILTYGVMTPHVLEAVEQLGIDADVIDLRWLDRASLDWDAITVSIQRTNEVVIVEQGARGTSYGGWLGDEISRRLFDWLDAPVHRIHGGEASPTISKILERAAFARTDEVVAGLEKILGQ